ncbi:phosphotransferase family protein [Thermomonospora amylolytica]|uniref:phosphotransferase family protein n=1 Tax=Thermomonospora amylolytica TaxID=1411117 RepID=UPI000E6CEBE0|nr:aminoglycoside phosphotransferase family protein [Thermomonospora amylolytica]
MGRRSEDVRELVAAYLHGYEVRSVTLLGEGEDNVAYEVNGELIVRFGKDSDAEERAGRVEGEARLLTAVAGLSPLPVPEPCFTVAQEGCLAYFKLPGVPLIDLPLRERSERSGSVGAVLGELLTALHSVRHDEATRLVEVDDHPKDLWLREAAEAYAAVGDRVPQTHRPAVEEFLAAPPPTDGYDLVFSHNDLGIEHVLVDPATGTVTGVIDWSDAAIVDPAYDFGLLYRDLGPHALDRALAGYRAEAPDRQALRARATFYARCTVFTDLAYGIETGRDEYLHKSLTALEWLFPPQAAPSR